MRTAQSIVLVSSAALVAVFTACGSDHAATPNGGGGGGGDAGTGGEAGVVESAFVCPVTTSDTEPGKTRVATDPRTGRWRTSFDPATCRFSLLGADDKPSILRGVSTTGLETGTRETASGAGYWIFQPPLVAPNVAPIATDAPKVLSNFIDVLTSKWKSKVIRLPMCSSGWAQQYQVHDFDPVTPHPVMDYKSWVDVAVKEARKSGAVVILDNHLWALGPAGSLGNDRGTFVSNGQTLKYSDYEDGCRAKKPDGTLDCAPKDFYSDDKNIWECPIANADGASIYNAYYNKDKIAAVWADVAARYKGDDGVWFELYNEPYARKATTTTDPGPNVAEADYPWDLWTDFMFTQIKAIRDTAGASNMVIVNGFDFGYDFGPDNGPIAHPDKYLPWVSKYPNVAYSFHPYQVASCCGEIGATTDSSATDPYESAFCSYYSDGSIDGANVPTAADLPVPDGKKCTNHGYGSLADKKMPPCTWVPTAKNPKTGAIGLCAGDRTVCGPKNETDCKAVDPASPAAGGWSKHALPMAKYGPLIATEFGSFDCSSAYVKNLLGYMDKFAISHTAWAAWPQNKGGPDGLGACGYPSVNKPAADGDFRKCINPADCAALIEPQPWSGMLTFEDLTSH